MKEIIISNINEPKELEKLYRLNPADFRREFNLIYPEVINKQLAGFWNERLNYENRTEIHGSSRRRLRRSGGGGVACPPTNHPLI